MSNKVKTRNEHAASLRLRAGNAGTAVAVDTRPKTIGNRKKANDRKKAKAELRTGRRED